jgi:uncharacterized protein (TIGR02271 family)
MQSNNIGQGYTSNPREVRDGEEVVLPVIEEEATIQTQAVERGKVQVLKRVETRDTVVNAPITHETVVVEHIPVNQYLEDDVPTAREVDGVLIIPVIEEVLFTEKRLILREEVRVFKQRKVATAPQAITLYREFVTVERTEISPSQNDQDQNWLNSSSRFESTPVANQATAPQGIASNLADSANLQAHEDARAIEPNLPADGTTMIEEELVIPVMAEEVTIQIQQVERGKVHIHKQVETREEVIDTSATYERVMVEHVPLNQYLDGEVPGVREEQGVLIIPVVEQVTIAEKRLLLREEVHVSRHRSTEIIPQTIGLRHEIVDIQQTQFEPVS